LKPVGFESKILKCYPKILTFNAVSIVFDEKAIQSSFSIDSG
jgi:hypothetical protein